MLLLVALGFAALAAVPAPASAWVPHAPIVINGNLDFTPANGVTAGSGTPADPYIIEGWDIDGSANSGIEIYNSDAHFVIRDIYVHSSLIDAIFLYSVRNGRVENATVAGNDGALYIQVSSNITVAASNISFNGLDAVVLDYANNITIEGNEMWNNGDWGVFTYESDDLVIRNNTISTNGRAGIELDWSRRATVEDNLVANHNVGGIILNTTSNVTIANNTIPDNDFNVDLTDSVDIMIRNNTVATSTSDGITITGGTRLTVEENNITGNGGGLLAVGVTELLVRHNAFFGNLPQAADNAGANTWDDGYPSGGNYWSDYAGVDNCSGPLQDICTASDGIGDTPYVIDADSRDRYPVMVPFGTGAPGYTVTVIPPLPGDITTIPWGINETGAVVGWSTDGSVERPFLFTDATGTVPLVQGATRLRGTARELNDAGAIAGGIYGPDPEQAVRWPSGAAVPELLGFLGSGPFSHAWGVNATGAVVGWSGDGGFSAHGFLYTDSGGMIDITPIGGQAMDINDAGRVTGWTGGSAFRWSAGNLESLGVPAGLARSWGYAINGAGQVAGCAESATGNTQRIARYTDGVGWEILGGAGDTNCAWGINAYGDVVGFGRPTGTGIVRSFLYTDAGGMQDLERMIDPALSLRVLDAMDINDRGQIIGYAWDNIAVKYVGVRLDPVVPSDRMLIATEPMGLQVRVDGVDRTTPYSLACIPGSIHTVEAPWTQPIDSDSRHAFTGWSDGGAQTHDIVCDPTQTVVANYGLEYLLVLNTNPAGLDIEFDAVVRTAPFPYWCAAGSSHTAVAVSPVAPAPDVLYVFLRWSDGNTAAARTIVCDAPGSYTAIYGAEYLVTFDTSPAGLRVIVEGISLATPHQRWCGEATTLSIGTASPQYLGSDRYDFEGWSDGGAQNHTITCTAPGTYVAMFFGAPLVTLLSPNGGEVWTGGSGHSIAWTMTDPDDTVLLVQVDLSLDSGATFTVPLWSGSLPVGPNSYGWVLPPVDVGTARVRVCVEDPGGARACDASDVDFAIDSTPPVVASVSPQDGEANVALDRPVIVTFSEPMNPASFPVTGVSIAPVVGGLAPTWSSPDGRVLTITHDLFAPCTTYTATVDAGGTDLSDPGNPQGLPVTWSFTTVCPPIVELLEPLGGEKWTGGSSHPIRFRVTDEADTQLDAWINATVNGVPSTLYEGPVPVGDASYPWAVPSSDGTVVVQVTVIDSSGRAAMSTSATFGIDATSPAVLETDPTDGLTDASVATQLTITFSEPMNTTSAERAVKVVPAVPLAPPLWDANHEVLTIRFAAALAENTDYVVTIGCGAKDDSDPGNALAGCTGDGIQVRFRTEIVASPPVAIAAAVTGARVGVPVTFDGSGSSGDVRTWGWTVTDGAGAVVATLSGAVVSHTFAEPGTYRVDLLVTDGFGRTDEYSFDLSVEAAGGGDGWPWTLAFVVAAILATLAFAATEPGRVALVTATAARIYARKPKDEKDSEIRGAILYYVRVHPGDCYMDIKRNLALNDGVVTYHLARLEKERLLRSAVRGARKRYYPAGMNVPAENGGELHEIQQRLVRLVAKEPGMPVAFLAEQLGVSEQLALYHLRKLAAADHVDLERRGLRLRAFPLRKT